MLKVEPCNHLSNREFEILQLLAEGWSNKRIAGKLCISIRTVKFHTSNIYVKIMVGCRSEAVAWAWKHAEILDAADD